MADTRATFEVPLQLIDADDPVVVTFYQPTQGQMAMMMRGVSLAQRSPTKMMHGVAQILDVIGALIVEPDQRDWMEDAMTNGVLDLDELVGVVNKIAEEDPDKPGVAKKPAQRAVRGRR
jgi:hypothetical protein